MEWEDYTFLEIIEKWNDFVVERRQRPPESAKTGIHHITVLDREALVENLISRLGSIVRDIEQRLDKK